MDRNSLCNNYSNWTNKKLKWKWASTLRIQSQWCYIFLPNNNYGTKTLVKFLYQHKENKKLLNKHRIISFLPFCPLYSVEFSFYSLVADILEGIIKKKTVFKVAYLVHLLRFWLRHPDSTFECLCLTPSWLLTPGSQAQVIGFLPHL